MLRRKESKEVDNRDKKRECYYTFKKEDKQR